MDPSFTLRCTNFQNGSTCLHLSKFCDHRVDCPDNSDEGPQCKQQVNPSPILSIILLVDKSDLSLDHPQG
jgi:hypothetical protein